MGIDHFAANLGNDSVSRPVGLDSCHIRAGLAPVLRFDVA
jgi:hypothetical protein